MPLLIRLAKEFYEDARQAVAGDEGAGDEAAAAVLVRDVRDAADELGAGEAKLIDERVGHPLFLRRYSIQQYILLSHQTKRGGSVKPPPQIKPIGHYRTIGWLVKDVRESRARNVSPNVAKANHIGSVIAIYVGHHARVPVDLPTTSVQSIRSNPL